MGWGQIVSAAVAGAVRACYNAATEELEATRMSPLAGGEMSSVRRWSLVALAIVAAAATGCDAGLSAGAPTASAPAPTTTPLATVSTRTPTVTPLATATPTPLPTSCTTAAPEPSARPTVTGSAVDAFSFEEVLIVGPNTHPYMNVAYKKGKTRIDLWVFDQWVVFFDDPETKALYAWYTRYGPVGWSETGENTILKMRAEESVSGPGALADPKGLFWGITQGIPVGARPVGVEDVDGKTCDRYEIPGGAPQRVWIWRETGLPLRSEWLTADKAVQRLELRNVRWGSAPDELLSLPEGMPIKEVEEIPIAPMMPLPGFSGLPEAGPGATATSPR